MTTRTCVDACRDGTVEASGTRPASDVLEVPMFRTAASTALLHRATARLRVGGPEAGMTTAEYAVGTVAACGFGGILYKIVTSPEIMGLLRDVIASAFKLSF
jgi:hypothetical protein